MNTPPAAVLLGLALVAGSAAGCARSFADLLRDKASIIEQKLQNERDATLSATNGSTRDARLNHLQTLRLGLSMVNVSIPTVPVFLKSDEERAIGYSVLDEALGTIDWNIPIYSSAASAEPRPYPTLFSPQTGLDFQAIRRGLSRTDTASPPGPGTPPGIAR